MKLDILQKLIALANNNPNEHEANLAARRVCKAIVEHKFIITYQGQTNTPPPKPRPTPNRPSPNPKPPTGTYYNPFTWDEENPFESSPFWDIFEEFGKRGSKKPPNPPKSGQWTKQEQPKGRKKSDELRERENSWQYEYYVVAIDEYFNPLTRKHYKMMFQDKWFDELKVRHYSDTKEFRAGANYGKPQDEPKTSYKTGYKNEQSSYTKAKTDEEYYQRRKDRGFGDEFRDLKCKTCGKIKKTKFVGIEEMFECNDCTWTAFERNKTPPKEEKKYGHVCHMTGGQCKTPVTCAGMGCSMRT